MKLPDTTGQKMAEKHWYKVTLHTSIEFAVI